mgnify:FL=1
MRLTDEQVTAAAKSLLKTTAIKDIQSELTRLDAVAMLGGEQMDRYYVCKRAMRLAAL